MTTFPYIKQNKTFWYKLLQVLNENYVEDNAWVVLISNANIAVACFQWKLLSNAWAVSCEQTLLLHFNENFLDPKFTVAIFSMKTVRQRASSVRWLLSTPWECQQRQNLLQTLRLIQMRWMGDKNAADTNAVDTNAVDGRYKCCWYKYSQYNCCWDECCWYKYSYDINDMHINV